MAFDIRAASAKEGTAEGGTGGCGLTAGAPWSADRGKNCKSGRNRDQPGICAHPR